MAGLWFTECGTTRLYVRCTVVQHFITDLEEREK